ncbi:MAG: isoleucine--tRNA ligase [Thermodesulfovibrionales bacterium]
MPEKDYKDTLNLPSTGFPMKANLPQREPEMLRFWESEKVYEALLEKNRGAEPYILHDGPPYANGHIHIGHALNKILKDIIVKYKAMKGHYAPYVPGWDCHGLPIELEVDKKLGSKGMEVGILEKRRLCREYAAKFVDIQREEFKRLGGFGDWHSPYLTMSFDYEGSIVRELMKFVRGGYVYKGKKPVHWCPSCVTALAEAEVEYADKESPSIYVRFRVAEEDLPRLGLAGREAYFVIWTTTPWTLPANLALAVHPDVEYVAVESEDKAVYIVAGSLLPRLEGSFVIRPARKGALPAFRGSDLAGLRARHPFVDRLSRVILGGFVTVEEGTGVVHIAPGHGEEDFEAGRREGLDIYAPVDDRGKFSGSGIGDIEGVFVFKANDVIIEMLKAGGALLHTEKLTHSYPHCWRCKRPVIFRATEQWFISMEQGELRSNSLREIDKVRWIPSWGKDRIYGMVERRPDWCISRQRTWGVPITLFACRGCGQTLTDEAVLEATVALVEKHGADIWFEKSADELLPEGVKCSRCGGTSFDKEKDILDVWFDSGVSHTILRKERGLSWPADMYLEGSDQHRGWFQSSLLASVGSTGSAPYRTVLTHGFTVDGRGKKMSKSLGNVIAPQDIIKATGAEILRLWVSAEDYRSDVKISDEIIARLTEAYRKIRNTARFLLGNLQDFDGRDWSGSLLEIDRWAMSRLEGLERKVMEAYEGFDFHEVYHRIHNFCVVDMSSFYLDILKDRLYTFRSDSAERRAAQWVLREILVSITRLMAPVMSFTAEEIWSFVPDKPARSVFLAGLPEPRREFSDPSLEETWAGLIAVRDEVLKALEIKRQERFIGNSLEAKVVLHPEGKAAELLSRYRDFLPSLFIVSQVELRDGEGERRAEAVEGLSITVERAGGRKCQRCWNWSDAVGQFPEAPDICERCRSNLP